MKPSLNPMKGLNPKRMRNNQKSRSIFAERDFSYIKKRSIYLLERKLLRFFCFRIIGLPIKGVGLYNYSGQII